MEDIFYFTRSRVTFQEIEELAIEAGYSCRYWDNGREISLHVEIDRTYTSSSRDDTTSEMTRREVRDYWLWSQWTEQDSMAFEPAEIERLIAYAPQAQFIISYHVPALPKLGLFLRQVTQEFGGWVACDDDWKVVYDVKTVEHIDCRNREKCKSDS